MNQTLILFINEDYLKRVTPIDSNIDSRTIVPSIQYCQKQFILNIIGTGIYNELITQVSANTLTVDNNTLLQDYIKPCLAQYVVYDLTEDLVYKFTNVGIQKLKTENSDSVTDKELEKIKFKLLDKAEYYANQISLFLLAHPTEYPLYNNPGNKIDTVIPNARDYTTGGGIFIPNSNRSGKFRFDKP